MLHELSFKGQWRQYQKRILDKSDTYMSDGKIHLVAAPGSGKTTLGIEFIRRFGNPSRPSPSGSNGLIVLKRHF